MLNGFKALNILAPVCVVGMLWPHTPTQSLRSAPRAPLKIPRTRLSQIKDGAFSAFAPRLWKALPNELESASTVAGPKTHLFGFAFAKPTACGSLPAFVAFFPWREGCQKASRYQM